MLFWILDVAYFLCLVLTLPLSYLTHTRNLKQVNETRTLIKAPEVKKLQRAFNQAQTITCICATTTHNQNWQHQQANSRKEIKLMQLQTRAFQKTTSTFNDN